MEMNLFSLNPLPTVVAFSVVRPAATAQQPMVVNEIVDKIAAREHAEMQLLRRYSPLVETYIQYIRADQHFGEVPDGDRYFLGRAVLAKGLELEPLNREGGTKR